MIWANAALFCSRIRASTEAAPATTMSLCLPFNMSASVRCSGASSSAGASCEMEEFRNRTLALGSPLKLPGKSSEASPSEL
jgi:hypothetical protein